MMKKSKELFRVLTVFILAGTFFTIGFFSEGQDETLSETDQTHDDSAKIEQSAGTEGGTTKRYIDMSNSFTGAYLHEDMKIEGKAEIKESFRMGNIDAGANVQAGVGEESGTKDASIEVEDNESGETEIESKQENNSEGYPGAEEEGRNPGDKKDSGPETGETIDYILEPTSPPEWAELF